MTDVLFLVNLQDIDGDKLQTLTTDDLTKLASVVDGPIMRLCDLVQQVKACTANNLSTS